MIYATVHEHVSAVRSECERDKLVMYIFIDLIIEIL